MRGGYCRNQKGFTLIEVLVALVVLVVAVLGVLNMQVVAVKGNGRAMAISRSVQEIAGGQAILAPLPFAELPVGERLPASSIAGCVAGSEGLLFTVEEVADTALVELLGLVGDQLPPASLRGKRVAVQAADGERTMHYLKIDW